MNDFQFNRELDRYHSRELARYLGEKTTYSTAQVTELLIQHICNDKQLTNEYVKDAVEELSESDIWDLAEEYEVIGENK